MNNGRPNQGNTSAWGQRPPQQNQPAGYGPRPGAQPPYQQTGYMNRPVQRAPYQPPQQGNPGYPQQPMQQSQQPYQQGFQQPNYNHANQAPYQQGYRPGQQPRPMPQPPQPQPPQQNTYYGPGFQQAYPGQPYPGYPQQGPYGQQPMQPPQPQQPAKPSFDPAIILWVMLCGVLPVLFVLGLVMSQLPVIKWIFVALAAVTVACLWIRPVMASNVRLTFSGVYGALAVVALVSVLTSAAPADNTVTSGGANNAGLLGGAQTAQQTADPGANDSLGTWSTEAPVVATATPQPDGLQSAAVEQMESFFYFWSVNNQENMLSLCAPTWRRSVSEPKVALFSILANRTPVEWTAEKITGTENDTARTVTVTADINKNNGKDPEKYRFQVILRKEDGQWYVDPASLESHEKTATETPTANETPTPTAEFIANAGTVLYYNADGGERYHLDAYCKSANEKYLPFKGQFTYSQINEEAYKELVACNVCGAPLRP